MHLIRISPQCTFALFFGCWCQCKILTIFHWHFHQWGRFSVPLPDVSPNQREIIRQTIHCQWIGSDIRLRIVRESQSDSIRISWIIFSINIVWVFSIFVDRCWLWPIKADQQKQIHYRPILNYSSKVVYQPITSANTTLYFPWINAEFLSSSQLYYMDLLTISFPKKELNKYRKLRRNLQGCSKMLTEFTVDTTAINISMKRTQNKETW